MGTFGTVAGTLAGLTVTVGAGFVLSPVLALALGLAFALGLAIALAGRVDPYVAGLGIAAGTGVLSLLWAVLRSLAPAVGQAAPAAVVHSWSPEVGVALLVAAALALVGLEIGVRAGSIVDARGLSNTEYGSAWEFPTAVLAIALLCWDVGAGGRALLVGLAGLLAGTHLAVVSLGGSVTHRAATLVPAALLLFVLLAAASPRAYVAPGVEPSLLHRVGLASAEARVADGAADDVPADAPADASDGAGVTDRAASVADGSVAADDGSGGVGPGGKRSGGDDRAPSPTAGSEPARPDAGASDVDPASGTAPNGTATVGAGRSSPDAATDVDAASGEPARSPAAGTGGRSASAAGASSAGAPEPASTTEDRPLDDWTWSDEDDAVPDVESESTIELDPDRAGEGAASSGTTLRDATAGSARSRPDVRRCQNCAAEPEACEARLVVAEPAVRVSLCDDCQAARVDAVSPLADCSERGLPVEVADAGTCRACGDAGELEAHPIVPPDAGGHRHSNNVLALCADCHEHVEDHCVAE